MRGHSDNGGFNSATTRYVLLREIVKSKEAPGPAMFEAFSKLVNPEKNSSTAMPIFRRFADSLGRIVHCVFATSRAILCMAVEAQ